MILRVPLPVQPRIAPFVTGMERLGNQLPGARWHNVFMARWRRR